MVPAGSEALNVTIHRFFVPPERIDGGRIHFLPETARQLRTVLRLQPGDRVVAFDGSGKEYIVRLDTVKEDAQGSIEEERSNQAEPQLRLTLYQGLLKGSKFELVLQKCTEIGVSVFVPVLTQRSIREEISANKKRRYESIIREAAEQSGRAEFQSSDDPFPLQQALRQCCDRELVIMPWEEERSLSLAALPLNGKQDVSLFIGPEGGFASRGGRLGSLVGSSRHNPRGKNPQSRDGGHRRVRSRPRPSRTTPTR